MSSIRIGSENISSASNYLILFSFFEGDPGDMLFLNKVFESLI